MCLKQIGVELALMAGTRPHIHAYIFYDADAAPKLPLVRSTLPTRMAFGPDLTALLAKARRKRGHHQPKRLVWSPWVRMPYYFFSAKLPGNGLPTPHDTLGDHLKVVVYVNSPQPIYHHPVLLYLKGSEPRVHPFGNRLQWVAHPHWTLADNLVRPTCLREETPCGCCVRLSYTFTPYAEAVCVR